MVVSLVAMAALAGTALAAPAAQSEVPRLVFPIVGPAAWTDDFGAPRQQGGHEGNDILSDWRAPVVAVEAGEVRLHTTSATAGCMLYLNGKSGTTYLYIHLNNDRTDRNDGKGGCQEGVAFAPGLETGDTVRAGELIGFVGSSGDAGATNHLHFELHPDDGAAVSPFKWLKRAERLLYVLPEDERAQAAVQSPTLSLRGTLEQVDVAPSAPEPEPAETVDEVAPTEPPAEAPPAAPAAPPPTESGLPAPGTLPTIGAERAAGALLVRIHVTEVELSTGGSFAVERDVVVAVLPETVVEREKNEKTRPATLDTAKPGEVVSLTTTPIQLAFRTQLARPGTLTAADIVLQTAA